jgi:hypothetical protein
MKLAFEVAGVRYRQEAFETAQVKKGDVVELQPEPTNKFDANAIKVVKDGHHIGYIPKMFTADVHSLIEQSVKTATIEAAWPDGCSIVFSGVANDCPEV